jgi:hypothetical protein
MDVMITIRASEMARLRWPGESPEEKMARDAFMEGARLVTVASQNLAIDAKRIELLSEIARQSQTGVSIECIKGEFRVMWRHQITNFYGDVREAIDAAAALLSSGVSDGTDKT